mmetsp:Transcript_20332/g.52487  ORF Transcript_20332/g.52487 Transcript_20332/m.52487 type:complete len:233 (+) Transcript_20332:232-930(+)
MSRSACSLISCEVSTLSFGSSGSSSSSSSSSLSSTSSSLMRMLLALLVSNSTRSSGTVDMMVALMAARDATVGGASSFFESSVATAAASCVLCSKRWMLRTQYSRPSSVRSSVSSTPSNVSRSTGALASRSTMCCTPARASTRVRVVRLRRASCCAVHLDGPTAARSLLSRVSSSLCSPPSIPSPTSASSTPTPSYLKRSTAACASSFACFVALMRFCESFVMRLSMLYVSS